MQKKQSAIGRNGTASRVLRYIVRNSPVSRSDISRAMELSPAMITSVVGGLVERGLVTDSGEKADGNGVPGRKRLLIEMNERASLAIGVEISRSHYLFCLRDFSHQSIAEYDLIPSAQDFEHVNETIVKGVRALLDSARQASASLCGVGVALPGHYDVESNAFITHSALWQSFDAQYLSEALALPVTCENNVRAMAYHSYFYQRADCPENFVFLHIGAGIFCASFLNGQLSVGDNFISGEVGHTVANPDGVACECGKNGCLQTYASETWLLKKAAFLYENSPQTMLRGLAPSAKELTIEQLLCAYDLGDEMVTHIMQDAIKYLGVAIANIAIIMSPQKVYLHSRYFRSERFRTSLSAFVNSQLLFVHRTYRMEIEILPFDSFRAARGAAAIALDRLFIRRDS